MNVQHEKPPGKRCGTAHRPQTGVRSQTNEPDWRRHLPDDWRDAVSPPLYFKCYQEYEISADRVVGYDADDLPCFTSHRFELTRLATDDDEEFYEVLTYSEELAAWRLRDERWLVFRMMNTDPCNPPRGFYAFSPDWPR